MHLHAFVFVYKCACVLVHPISNLAHQKPKYNPLPRNTESQKLEEAQELLGMFSVLFALLVSQDVVGDQLRVDSPTCRTSELLMNTVFGIPAGQCFVCWRF